MQIPVLAICGPSSSTPLLKPRPRGSGKSLPVGSLGPRADQLVDVGVHRTGSGVHFVRAAGSLGLISE